MQRLGFKRRRVFIKPKRPSQRRVAFYEEEVGVNQSSITLYAVPSDGSPVTLTNMRLDIGGTVLPTNDYIRYALVVLPENYAFNTDPINSNTTNIVEPAEAVVLAGQLNSINLQDHKWARISRKLREGDSLVLLTVGSSGNLQCSVQFECTILS